MTGPTRTRPGRPYPLGASWDGAGVNFALFSEHASAVDLSLFDSGYPGREIARLPVRERTDQVWHVYLPEARPGLLYGYRVQGPWAPSEGHRFNPAKALLDPYAKAITRNLRWHDALFGHRLDDPDRPDERDSAPWVPKSVVTDTAFTWGDDRSPHIPWHTTVIYEMHVKGFTARHPGVPAELRGTYAGLASPAAVDHLRHLGVTAVELLPVHHAVTEKHLQDRGLSNYWGYNSIGYLAPDARFASSGDRGQQVDEFKTMVKTLHQAGIEVILDVVYNHTAEGNHLGPTLCFRGIDNAAYYRLSAEEPRHYQDYTGCGNTLDMTHPRAIQLIMDSLRYWVNEMHVDGFRFDLASALARELHDVNRLSAFFDVIHQDPVISQVKLIAEPWDLGAGGYQVGNFPVGWAEWNGRYRDTVRRYWRADEGQMAELGYRLTGSSDLYERSGRRPYASVNFVTAHDGLTLHDLVAYNGKHNEQNGENNTDGADDDMSWNGGAEGPTDNLEILAVRERQMRNFLTTLLLSQGIPMLTAGDEIARSQGGNNNAYCQDTGDFWLPWERTPAGEQQLAFTRRLIALRLGNAVFHRRSFFQGRQVRGGRGRDLTWFRPDGQEMTETDWQDARARCVGLRLAGGAIEETDELGRPIVGDSFLVLLNAHHDDISFALPGDGAGAHWEPVLDTRDWETKPGPGLAAGEAYPLMARSLAVLRLSSSGSERGPAR